MLWDWLAQLVLPILALVLAALILRLLGTSRTSTDVERTVLAVLAVILLGVAGWWVGSWLVSADLLQHATRPRAR